MNDHDDYIEALKMTMSSPINYDDISASARNAIFSTNTGTGAVGVDSWSSYNAIGAAGPQRITSDAIKGEMLFANAEYSAFEIMDIGDDEIKRRLCTLIANKLYDSKFIEFTKQLNPATGRHNIRARAFMTPSGDVQILRKSGY